MLEYTEKNRLNFHSQWASLGALALPSLCVLHPGASRQLSGSLPLLLGTEHKILSCSQ